jgi:organic hydroperoxide reductase OsmC/OhrA
MSQLEKVLYTAKTHATGGRDTAEILIEATHTVCPYSRATHGNIDVTTILV